MASCHRDPPAGGTAAGSPSGAARIAVAVDRRVELFSVLERLAGAPEYAVAATPYAAAADTWFAPVAHDPAVEALRSLRQERGISYDATLTLAAQLDDQLRPLRPLSPLPDGLDARWDGVDLDTLLAQVRAFATTSRFDDFRASQAAYSGAVEDRLRTFVAARSLVPWFDAAFGARAGARYRIAPGLLTGAMSYGLHAGSDIEEVIDLEAPDDHGLPAFGTVTESLLAHELAHSYVNPIVHAHLGELSGASPTLDAAAPIMARQHYTTREIVVDESLVRAVTIAYLRERVSTAAANADLAQQQQRLGFAWTSALLAALDGRPRPWSAADLVAAAAAAIPIR